jgi:small-conductance mechanosensitive channel
MSSHGFLDLEKMPIQLPFTTGELVADVELVLFKAAIFLAIIVIGWVVGKVLGLLVGRVLARAGGDSLLKQTVIGRALMRADFASFRLGNSVTKWLIYLSAFLYALYSLGLPVLTTSVLSVLDYLPVIIGSGIILIVGMILSDWVGEFVKKSVSPEKRELFYLNIVGDTIKVILYFVTITLALTHLGVDVTILYIFSEAFAWAIAISVGVAAGIIVGWVLKDRVKEWISSISGSST